MEPATVKDTALGGTIVTYTGKAFKPLRPDPELIDIKDIAHALSNNCRFTGHVKRFYSVAQHSVLCSLIVEPENALAALLHDGSEAYLSDIARPIKLEPEFGGPYKVAEARLEAAVAEKFGLKYPWCPNIKWADNVLLRSEQRDLMPQRLTHEGEEFLDMEIKTWIPSDAKAAFLWRFYTLDLHPGLTLIPPSFMGPTLGVGVSKDGDS